MRVGAMAAALAALALTPVVEAFGVSRGTSTGGLVHILGASQATSSFLKGGRGRRTGASSPTSLCSAYAVKPDMARSRGSQWRKLRTRGPGFGEKVSFGLESGVLVCTVRRCRRVLQCVVFFRSLLIFLQTTLALTPVPSWKVCRVHYSSPAKSGSLPQPT